MEMVRIILVGMIAVLSTCGVQNDQDTMPAIADIGDHASCNFSSCKADPQGSCALTQQKGNLQFVDCGQAFDGPAYFIKVQTGEIVARCGGFLMSPNAPDRARCSFEALEEEKL